MTKEEIIMIAFQKHLGVILDELDENDRNIYALDYSLFKAGWLACNSNEVANNGINPTAKFLARIYRRKKCKLLL